MVFHNHTRGVRVEGDAVRELLESTFADQPDLRFHSRRRYLGEDFVVSEWTATATAADGQAIEWDGIDVFPFRDGLIARKDVYSGSHAPRPLAEGAAG
jgi:ketosteroid isomerase-like protein